MSRACLLLPFLAACATGAPAGLPGDDDAPGLIDAGPGLADAAGSPVDASGGGLIDAGDQTPIDAMPPEPPAVAPLLITEIVLAPTGAEMIEIGNPTTSRSRSATTTSPTPATTSGCPRAR